MTYYPPLSFYFSVEVAGFKSENSFQEVSGLKMEIATDEVIEGGENRFTVRLPKTPKFTNVVLKRGLLINSSLMNWCRKAFEEFKFEPKQVTIRLIKPNTKSDALVTWVLENAYPVSWSVSDLKSEDNALAIESLELTYTYFTQS